MIAESDAEKEERLGYVLPPSGHVRIHRLWAFAVLESELTSGEHIHVLYCPECQFILTECLQAETFGALLKRIQREDDTTAGDDDAQGAKAG